MAPITQSKFEARSMGVKLIVIGGLALLMCVPALFVASLVDERSRRSNEVSQSIGASLGGTQTFLGPLLALPYTLPDGPKKPRVDQGIYIVFPTSGEAEITTKSEVRHRSLFKVTAYTATIQFKASFDPLLFQPNLPAHAELDWTRAEFIVGASDSRGALADATLTGGGTTRNMALSGLLSSLPLSLPNKEHRGLKIFGLRTGNAIGPNSKFELTAAMKFSGAQQLSVLPFAKSTEITIRGDWPHPGFSGGFLPATQSASAQGFQAHWSIPFIARGISSAVPSDGIANLLPLAPAVAFVELADRYQSVTRSLKYALLFLCLVFSSFFVFEATTGKRIHPAQYFLIGAAQLIFYLLLLSIAERIGFTPAFAIASVATVSLISIDANWIFESKRQGVRAFAVFSMVYGLIYVLLTLEDEALLIGSIASFLVVAAIMYLTRYIDWYGQDQSRMTAPS